MVPTIEARRKDNASEIEQPMDQTSQETSTQFVLSVPVETTKGKPCKQNSYMERAVSLFWPIPYSARMQVVIGTTYEGFYFPLTGPLSQLGNASNSLPNKTATRWLCVYRAHEGKISIKANAMQSTESIDTVISNNNIEVINRERNKGVKSDRQNSKEGTLDLPIKRPRL